MNTKTLTQDSGLARRWLLPLVTVVALSFPIAASATTTPVDDLSTEVGKITNIADSLFPVVVGVIAFSGAAIIAKRVIFS